MSETIPPREARLGVFVCDCGGQVSQRLDTEAVRQRAAARPGVVAARREAWPCSPDGRARLQRLIQAEGLDGVLVAGCAPRLVEKLFRETVQAAGLPATMLEIANVREQCALAHGDDRVAATEKAADLVAMGLARLASVSPVGPQAEPVYNAALVVGGGLGGLTAALTLAESGAPVTLVEAASALGGLSPDYDEERQAQLAERVAAVEAHAGIRRLLHARVADVSGGPGHYTVTVEQAGQRHTLTFGAVVLALGAQPLPLGDRPWRDRRLVRTQAEFAAELAAGGVVDLRRIVIELCAEREAVGRCSRVCCRAGLRQALQAKRLQPQAEVTILYRDLFLGGPAGDAAWDELVEAQAAGVAFLRYHPAHPPVIGEKSVIVPIPATQDAVELPFDRLVLALPWGPHPEAARLAALFRLPHDEAGFLLERRDRLRPGQARDDGVFVIGGLHQPTEPEEILLQAYMAGARARRFLAQGSLPRTTPAAAVRAELCTGCATCVPTCPWSAISLQERPGVLSLARIDARRCTNCGNCVVACPVKAIDLPGCEDAALLAQIEAALAGPGPRVLVFACEWSAYAAADLAGARRRTYPAEMRIIRLGCSARLDPDHILWAFLNGAQGVLVGVCPAGDCHHGVGNRWAEERVALLQRQLTERGLNPRRLRLEHLPGDDGRRFAEVVNGFAAELSSTYLQR